MASESDTKLKTPTQEQGEKAQKELEKKAAETANLAQAKVEITKLFMRTRYVYEVLDKKTLRSMFEISFFESNPENVITKANMILANNSANPAGLSLKLKYLEVVE